MHIRSNIKIARNKFKESFIILFIWAFLFCNNESFSVLHNWMFFLPLFCLALMEILNKRVISITFEIKMVFLLLAFALVSMLRAGDQLFLNNGLAYLVSILFVLLSLCLYDDNFNFDKINKSYIVFGLIIAVRLILYGETGSTLASINRYSITAIGGNAYYEVNCLCLVLVLPTLISVFFALNCKGSRKFYVATSIIMSIATLLTGSRNGFVCICIGAILIIMIKFSEMKTSAKNKIFHISIVVLVLTIIVLLMYRILPTDITDRLIRSSYNDEGNQSRLKHWYFAIKTIVDSPILGKGVVGSNNAIYSVTGINFVAHNSFLGFYIEYGLGSLLIILIILFRAMLKALKTKQYVFFSISIVMFFAFNILELSYLFTFWIYFLFSCFVTMTNKEVFPR